jgi:hypothetical protein
MPKRWAQIGSANKAVFFGSAAEYDTKYLPSRGLDQVQARTACVRLWCIWPNTAQTVKELGLHCPHPPPDWGTLLARFQYQHQGSGHNLNICTSKSYISFNINKHYSTYADHWATLFTGFNGVLVTLTPSRSALTISNLKNPSSVLFIAIVKLRCFNSPMLWTLHSTYT